MGLSEGTRNRLAAQLAPAALLLYATALFGWLQLQTPHLVDRDGYFHARYAALLPERGLARDFPAASRSLLAERFSDKELLFHAALAPLCAAAGDPARAAKVLVVALDVAVVAAAFFALRALGARWPALFAALLVACGNHFLFRLLMARPHLGSVVLAIAGTAALLTDRHRLTFAIGFVYSWAYAAPYVLVGLAALDALGRAAASGGDKIELRPLLAAAGGVLAGLVVHPYFPNDLALFWTQNVTVLSAAWGEGGALKLGAEFDPVTTRSLLLTSTGALACFLGGAAAAIAARERPSPRTVSLFFMAGGTLALFLLSAKFVEYFAPLAVLFLASAATDALGGRPVASRRARAGLAIAAAWAILLHARAVDLTARAVRATPAPALAGAAGWLDRNAAPGTVVAHLSWADFSTLYYFAPRQRYLNGMDPVFMAAVDPEGARALEDMREGRRPLDGAEIARRFGARFLVVSQERAGAFEAATYAGLEPVYEDGRGAVFKLPD